MDKQKSAMSPHTCGKCNITLANKYIYQRHLETNKHKMTTEEYKEFNSQRTTVTFKNGRANELYIIDILSQLKYFEDIIDYGVSGNKFDIFVKCPNEEFYRGLQVKTIHRDNRDKSSYDIKIGGRYEKDTLIIGVTNEHDKFTLLTFGNLDSLRINFSPKNKYKLIDLKKFTKMLVKYVCQSTVVYNINDYFYRNQKTEADSMDRFRNKCTELGIEFRKNITTNMDEIDATVNNFNVQFKASGHSPKSTSKYQFNLSRSLSNGIRPYNENDNIQYFIFEIVAEKYMNNFYIIPTQFLMDNGYISTANNVGKYSIQIPTPDYNKHDWCLSFLNKFEQLTLSKINVPVSYSNLHECCLSKQLPCTTSLIGKKCTLTHINCHRIMHVKHVLCRKDTLAFPIRLGKVSDWRPIHINDGYSFIIFDYGKMYKNQFCIIPIGVLIEEGYIATDDQKGWKFISLAYPDSSNPHWSMKYINKFELLT
jgi:hypothetical protein